MEYVISVLYLGAALALLYADGVLRDRYHAFLNGIALRQSLCALALCLLLLLAGKRLAGGKRLKLLILVAVIPLFLFAVGMVSGNAAAAMRIVAGSPF